MKLNVFDAEVLPQRSGKIGQACISFGKKGAIMISKKAAEAIGINDGSKIIIGQDEDNPEDWYISINEKGWTVRLHSDKRSFVFSHAKFCEMYKEAMGYDTNESKKVRIATNPVVVGKEKYFAILVG